MNPLKIQNPGIERNFAVFFMIRKDEKEGD